MTDSIKLGLKENWQQFTILVIVNAFVGGMVGLERSIFPQFAEVEFGVATTSAVLSFIIAFGITKALANYFTGRLANKTCLFMVFFLLKLELICVKSSSTSTQIYLNLPN